MSIPPSFCHAQMPDIQADVLFGNIEEVTEFSGEFLLALEEACQNIKQAQVGRVFVTFAPRIKSVYGVYCRNHDSASALYEKVSHSHDHTDDTLLADSITSTWRHPTLLTIFGTPWIS